jgi:hypothetical protein
MPLDENTLNELTVSFKGLSDFEIRQILNLAYQQSGMDDVGGLTALKKYLRDKSFIYNNLGEARKFGIDIPKGILIVGMPGCGKSLTAKATQFFLLNRLLERQPLCRCSLCPSRNGRSLNRYAEQISVVIILKINVGIFRERAHDALPKTASLLAYALPR